MKKNTFVFYLTCLFVSTSLHGAANKSVNKHILEAFSSLKLSSFDHVLTTGIENHDYSLEYAIKNVLFIDGPTFITNKTVSNSYAKSGDFKYGEPEEYDALIVLWTLHVAPDCAKALSSMVQSLKPGREAIFVHCISTPALQPCAQELLATEKWADYYRNLIAPEGLSAATLQSALIQAGLTVKSFNIAIDHATIPPATLTQHWCSSGFLNFLPEGRREEFCRDVITEFIKKNPLNEKGELTNNHKVAVIVLTKESAA